MNHEIANIVFRSIIAGIIGFALGRLCKLPRNKTKDGGNNRHQGC